MKFRKFGGAILWLAIILWVLLVVVLKLNIGILGFSL